MRVDTSIPAPLKPQVHTESLHIIQAPVVLGVWIFGILAQLIGRRRHQRHLFVESYSAACVSKLSGYEAARVETRASDEWIEWLRRSQNNP